jgi:subtilisin family serine protease
MADTRWIDDVCGQRWSAAGCTGVMRRRVVLTTGVAGAAVALMLAPVGTARAAPDAVAGEVIVRFAGDATAAERGGLRREVGGTVEETLPLPNTEVLRLPPGASAGRAIDELERSPDVAYAEPNVVRRASVLPSDRWSGYLWGLENRGQNVAGTTGAVDADTDGAEALDRAAGSAAVAVAVIDTGVALDHPDLAGAGSVNAGEAGALGANGVDDDADGFVDDSHGWDFVDDDNRPDDLNGHGTHVSGTIAARAGNTLGIAGIAPRASILPLRVLDAGGSGSVADLVAAYRYAARQGVRVVNLSLGGPDFSRAERDAIAAAKNVLFVVAAGNGGADGVGDNVDATPQYPCAHALDNIVCVGASDQRDALAGFSNFGARSVDLLAPGVNVLSTVPAEGASYTEYDYAFLDGTSMATPHVAGAAMIAGREPNIAVDDLKQALLGSTDPLPQAASRTVTGGRLNAHAALARRDGTGPATTGDPTAPSPAPVPAPAPPAPAPTPAPPLRPAPSAPAAALPDRSAPLVMIDESPPRQGLAGVRRRGLRARVNCSEPCTLTIQLRIARTTARRIGLGAGRSGAVLARARRTLREPAVVRLRLTAAARRALGRTRTLAATLRAHARDPAGNTRTVLTRTRLR